MTLIAISVLCLRSFPSAHDIASDVVIHGLIKPEGGRLHVLVRVPLVALANLNLPRRGPGYLALEALDDQFMRQVAARVAEGMSIFENDVPLKEFETRDTRIALVSDQSFASYSQAVAHLTGPRLPEQTEVFWNQGFLDIHFEHAIQSDESDFSLRAFTTPTPAGRTVMAVRFLPPSGATHSYEFAGDAGLVRLDPRWRQAAWIFVKSGFARLISGPDHLLFLFCLIVPLRRVRQVIVVVTAFTVAHSITLIAATNGITPIGNWYPLLVETLIALSVVYMAIENLVAADPARRRWLMAFVFGLVHGLGFSLALRQALQFAGSHFVVSLLSFNVGVELGQVTVLAITVPALGLLFRYVRAERLSTIVLSVLLAHMGWHWMTERGSRLWLVEWPTPDLMVLATLTRWLLVLVVVATVLWLFSSLRWLRRMRSIPKTETDITT